MNGKVRVENFHSKILNYSLQIGSTERQDGKREDVQGYERNVKKGKKNQLRGVAQSVSQYLYSHSFKAGPPRQNANLMSSRRIPRLPTLARCQIALYKVSYYQTS